MRTAFLLAACTALSTQAAIWELDLGPETGGFGLTGDNERPLPPTPSPATGKESPIGGVGIRYDDDSNVLTLHYGWGNVTDVDGVNLTGDFGRVGEVTFGGMHIHGPASTEEFAGIIYDLMAEDAADPQVGLTPGDPRREEAPDLRSGYFDFNLTLRDGVGGLTVAQQEAQLLGNEWYINIHTDGTYSAGEIRGQLIAIPEPHHYAAFAGLALLGFAGFRRYKAAQAA